MPELNSFDEQLRSAFDSFKPEVTPDFGAFEQALNRRMSSNNDVISKRYKAVRRIAMTSTVVALSLMGYMLVQLDDQVIPEKDGNNSEAVQWHKFEQNEPVSSKPGYLFIEDASSGSSARTSNSLLIRDELAAGKESTSSDHPLDRTEEPTAATNKPIGSSSNADEVATNRDRGAQDIASDPEEIPSESSASAALGFESSVQEACEGTEVSFKLDGDWAEGSFLWNFGDGAFSSDSEPSHVFNRPGTYDITISVRSHNDGQIRTRTVENMIVVRPRPDAAFSWKLPEAVIGESVSVQLLNQTERSSSSTWLLGEEQLNSSTSKLKIPGEYPVHLIASNAYGCQDHSIETLRLGDRLGAGAPSSFSPNGDGRYDSFLPKAAAESSGNWSFSVFDSDEVEVFRTDNAQRPWNGELIDGASSEGKRFQWVLIMNDRDGNPMLYSDEVRVE